MGQNKKMIDYPDYDKTYKSNIHVLELIEYLKTMPIIEKKDHLRILRERLETLPERYKVGI